MSKKKAKPTEPENPESDFLDFKTGTPFEYEGIVTGFGKLPSTQKEGENFFYLQFQDGTKCAMSVMLSTKIMVARNDESIGFDIGSKVKLIYKGKKDLKGGKKLNVIDVYINGSLIEPQKIESEEFFEAVKNDLPF